MVMYKFRDSQPCGIISTIITTTITTMSRLSPWLSLLGVLGLLSASAPSVNGGRPPLPRSLLQFHQMLLCVMPNSWPLFSFTRYGCYCGLGGSGQPLDELDRCCQTHDECYAETQQLPGYCHPFFRHYDFTCVDHVVTCGEYSVGTQ
uniref:Phospholipase A2 n=1 Tax=Petromyzon marinus TaxID=7757 RepID=A0AAJ7WJX1_PETMA|nr:acidic phospholipase A2 PL-I-like [Petromyzon marinus]